MTPKIFLFTRDEAVRRAVIEGASQAEHDLRTFDRPEALADATAEAPPDLVVLDIAADPDAGLELCRELRGALRECRTPLIAIIDSDRESLALGVGATLFLAPPVRPEDVEAVATALVEEPSAAGELEAALDALRRGDVSAARAALAGLADARPDSLLGAWARYLSAQAAQALGDAQAALEELDAVVQERPTFWRARVQLGALFEAAGHGDEAARHYRRALAARPDQPDVRRRLAAATGESVDADRGEPPALIAPEDADESPSAETTQELGAPDEAASGAAPPDQPRATILVADDSELALAMAEDALTAAGFRVVTASNGEDAVDLAREHRPDLVILDGLMPGKTGFEACQEIKDVVLRDRPPRVIIWSAIYTKQRQRTEARELYKADDVVPKATDDERLVATVRRFLDQPPD